MLVGVLSPVVTMSWTFRTVKVYALDCIRSGVCPVQDARERVYSDACRCSESCCDDVFNIRAVEDLLAVLYRCWSLPSKVFQHVRSTAMLVGVLSPVVTMSSTLEPSRFARWIVSVLESAQYM